MGIISRLNTLNADTIVNGLEVFVQSDGAYVFNFLKLKKEGVRFNVLISKSNISDMQILQENISPKEPVILVINGKGVINKKIKCGDNDSMKLFLNKVLPNANDSEFSLQRIKINDNDSFVSIIRSSVLNDILILLNSKKIMLITNCFLGPFVLNYSLSIIEMKGQSLFLNYKLTFDGNTIVDFETLPDFSVENNFVIGGENLDIKCLIPFSAALSHFMNSDKGVVNHLKLNEIILDSIEKKKFEFRGWILLFTSLIILIVNLLFFNNYWSKNEDLLSQLELSSSSLRSVVTLKNELTLKKAFLEQNGMLENSMTSYYADCLADELPSSIVWTSLDIHPLKKNDASSVSDVLEFENNTIRISGNCQQSIDLNNWMKKIKKFEWIENVELLNYKQENVKENGFFLLEVTLK